MDAASAIDALFSFNFHLGSTNASGKRLSVTERLTWGGKVEAGIRQYARYETPFNIS